MFTYKISICITLLDSKCWLFLFLLILIGSYRGWFPIRFCLNFVVGGGDYRKNRKNNMIQVMQSFYAIRCFHFLHPLAWITLLFRIVYSVCTLERFSGELTLFQACGVLGAVEPLNSFLASLCKFTISIPTETEKKRWLSIS